MQIFYDNIYKFKRKNENIVVDRGHLIVQKKWYIMCKQNRRFKFNSFKNNT